MWWGVYVCVQLCVCVEGSCMGGETDGAEIPTKYMCLLGILRRGVGWQKAQGSRLPETSLPRGRGSGLGSGSGLWQGPGRHGQPQATYDIIHSSPGQGRHKSRVRCVCACGQIGVACDVGD
ncbi:unnamed protein product [Discosporangium mesarthrocarpum]